MSEKEIKNQGVSRRGFFRAAGLAGLGGLAGASLLAPVAPARAESQAPKEPLPRRPFGRSGIMVSALSLGGMFDILNNRLMLKMALDWGLNYWDTAEGYGGSRSEEGIGRWFARNPDTRQEVFLVTKLQIKTEVIESDISRIRIGQKAFVKSPAFPGREFEGTVSALAPTLAAPRLGARGPRRPTDVDVLEVTIDVDGESPLLPGMRVDAFFRGS